MVSVKVPRTGQFDIRPDEKGQLAIFNPLGQEVIWWKGIDSATHLISCNYNDTP